MDSIEKKGKILIIDDDQVFTRELIGAFSNHLYDIAIAPTIEAARNILTKNKFDILLIDMSVKRLESNQNYDNLKLVETIKKENMIPVIIGIEISKRKTQLENTYLNIIDFFLYKDEFNHAIWNKKFMIAINKIIRQTETKFLSIELIQEYEKFENQKIFELLRNLRVELNLKNEIKLLLKEAGSVLLMVEIKQGDFHKFHLAIQSGELKKYGIEELKVKEFLIDEIKLNDKISKYKKILLEENGLSKLLINLEKNLKNDSFFYNDIILLTKRNQQLERGIRNGVLSYNEEVIQYNRIIVNVCDLLDKLKEKDLYYY